MEGDYSDGESPARETIDVDRDYLWALEVIAAEQMGVDDPSDDDRDAARRVVENANFNRPRDR